MQIDMIEVCKLSLNKSHELDQKQKSFESRYEIHFHSQCETWLSWAPMAPFHGQVPGAKVHLNQTKEEEEENQSTKNESTRKIACAWLKLNSFDSNIFAIY